MAGNAQLHRAVQGVDVRVQVNGRPVHAVIVREVLEQHFNAGTSPQSWLEAYRRNAEAIDKLIARRWRCDPQQPVILKPDDL